MTTTPTMRLHQRMIFNNNNKNRLPFVCLYLFLGSGACASPLTEVPEGGHNNDQITSHQHRRRRGIECPREREKERKGREGI